MKNVPIPQLQQWLGHLTINMTMRYAHLAPGAGAHFIKALDGDSVANPWQIPSDSSLSS